MDLYDHKDYRLPPTWDLSNRMDSSGEQNSGGTNNILGWINLCPSLLGQEMLSNTHLNSALCVIHPLYHAPRKAYHPLFFYGPTQKAQILSDFVPRSLLLIRASLWNEVPPHSNGLGYIHRVRWFQKQMEINTGCPCVSYWTSQNIMVLGTVFGNHLLKGWLNARGSGRMDGSQTRTSDMEKQQTFRLFVFPAIPIIIIGRV